MRLPEKHQIPFYATDLPLQINETKMSEFHRAFREKGGFIPPTLMAISMKGIFDLLHSFEIDWRKLLHATQSFAYLGPLRSPSELLAKTALIDIKLKAGHYWLQFQTDTFDQKSGERLIQSKSLLMLKADL